jgi:hypothetical protein
VHGCCKLLEGFVCLVAIKEKLNCQEHEANGSVVNGEYVPDIQSNASPFFPTDNAGLLDYMAMSHLCHPPSTARKLETQGSTPLSNPPSTQAARPQG